jgi:hypothetical protein
MSEQAAELHKLARENHDVPSYRASIDAWDKVAVYVEPKLKSVGNQLEMGEPVPFIINIVEPNSD